MTAGKWLALRAMLFVAGVLAGAVALAVRYPKERERKMAHQTKPSRAPKLILGALLFIAGWYAGAYFQPIFNPPPCTLTEAARQTVGGFLFGAPTPTPEPKGWWER